MRGAPDPSLSPAVPERRARPRGRVATVVLVGVGLGIVGLILWPFLPGLVLAAVLATLCNPLHRRVEARIGLPSVAAMVSTLAVVLLLLLPLSALAVAVGTQAVRGIQLISGAGARFGEAGDGLTGLLMAVAGRFGIDPATVAPLIATQLERLASLLASRTLGFLSGIGGWLLQLGVALVTLFYLLRDWPELLSRLRRLIPLEPERVDQMLRRARDVTQATVFGNVLVAMVQGLLGGIAFALVGLPAATLWGTIMGFLALIPLVGPPAVWVPAAIFLVLNGELLRALALAAMGALVIGTMDNLLRAVFVGGRARVHSLVVFLSVLGGLFLFGAVGVVAGPVLFVLALLALEMGQLTAEAAERRATVTPPEAPPVTGSAPPPSSPAP